MRDRIIACLIALLLAGCSVGVGGDSAPAPVPAAIDAAAAGEVDYRCTTDSDCAVKDVGNCCGYYPACVNAGSPTFPERVREECAREGTAGICGFPDISGCRCVAGRCESDGGEPGGLPLD